MMRISSPPACWAVRRAHGGITGCLDEACRAGKRRCDGRDIAAAHRQMGFEDYERAMRATLGWQD
jgi:hypothetical protein